MALFGSTRRILAYVAFAGVITLTAASTTETLRSRRSDETHDRDGKHQNSNKRVQEDGPVVDMKFAPMGFMSWERFRCQIDCEKYPKECINENLYMEMADALVDGGYADYGYVEIHIDDCWSAGRDPTTKELLADPERFPSGMEALSKYIHNKGLEFGLYSDAGPKTCAGYEGSMGYEEVDAATFARWNVDYVKYDGCNLRLDEMEAAYTKFGNALKQVSAEKEMVYSCSWPAYITYDNGGDESAVPFDIMYKVAGCNTWRNWHDIDNSWESLRSIVYHWGDNWKTLHSIPKGSFNDADMLLIGDDHYGSILTLDQARLQFGFWAIISSPLLIGGDIRKITKDYKDIMLNGYLLSINQDRAMNQPSCLLGCKDTPSGKSGIQLWFKELQGEALKNYAFGFFNLDDTVANKITYTFSLPQHPGAILCSDVWSIDPSHTVCPMTTTSENDEWEIVMKDLEDGSFSLEMSALNLPPTSHRMLRLYLRYSDSNEDEWTKESFQDEISTIAQK